MSESLVGIIVTWTRQNAPGTLNGVAPAGTTSDRVILAADIVRPERFSHDPAAMTGTGPERNAKGITGADASQTPLLHRARLLRTFITEFLENRWGARAGPSGELLYQCLVFPLLKIA
jgi:hypothetical protein